METLTCPCCQNLIDKTMVSCPHCGTQLKAYGHPGIPLHYAQPNEYLCDNCTYHADDSCNYPKRPYAKTCTLYENINERQAEIQQQQQADSLNNKIQQWIKRNQSLILILALLMFCIAITLIR